MIPEDEDEIVLEEIEIFDCFEDESLNEDNEDEDERISWAEYGAYSFQRSR
jgi:hypothetical protein